MGAGLKDTRSLAFLTLRIVYEYVERGVVDVQYGCCGEFNTWDSEVICEV